MSLWIDGHYWAFVKCGGVKVLQHQFVNGFVPDQEDQGFQHLRVLVGNDPEPVSIVNCHAPASKKQGLTLDARKRTLLACHKACAGDRFIWGGDFKTGVIQLSALLLEIDKSYATDVSAARPDPSAAQAGLLQLVFSHPSNYKQGDLAMIYGLRSIQTHSQVGASCGGVSEVNDLVVAKVTGFGGSRPGTRVTKAYPPLVWTATRSPPRSAAQPKASSKVVLKPATRSQPRSAAQPATSSTAVHQPVTPRVDRIFGNDAADDEALREVLDKIGKHWLFGKMMPLTVTGRVLLEHDLEAGGVLAGRRGAA